VITQASPEVNEPPKPDKPLEIPLGYIPKVPFCPSDVPLSQ
jgi:hypothetical protein